MSTEWSVSFEYRITGVVSSWGSIVHLTIGSNIVQMGQRTTAVFTLPNSQKLIFNTTLHDETNYICRSVENLELNRVYKIEVHQRYISNGNYRYFIKIDREEIHSTINSKARQFYNVKVYASNPSIDASQGLISNFILQTFFISKTSNISSPTHKKEVCNEVDLVI